MEVVTKTLLCPVDPRARRTRAALEEAWRAIKAERPCADVSVSELTARAEVSRATFYDHFADLRELGFAVLRADFQAALREAVPAGTPFARVGAEAFALAVYRFLESLYANRYAPPAERELPIRAALHETVHAFLTDWLGEDRGATSRFPGASREGIALALSWATFGGASSWRRLSNRPPAEEAARTIVAPFFTRLGAE